jgi:hypothetical protein
MVNSAVGLCVGETFLKLTTIGAACKPCSAVTLLLGRLVPPANRQEIANATIAKHSATAAGPAHGRERLETLFINLDMPNTPIHSRPIPFRVGERTQRPSNAAEGGFRWTPLLKAISGPSLRHAS